MNKASKFMLITCIEALEEEAARVTEFTIMMEGEGDTVVLDRISKGLSDCRGVIDPEEMLKSGDWRQRYVAAKIIILLPTGERSPSLNAAVKRAQKIEKNENVQVALRGLCAV